VRLAEVGTGEPLATCPRAGAIDSADCFSFRYRVKRGRCHHAGKDGSAFDSSNTGYPSRCRGRGEIPAARPTSQESFGSRQGRHGNKKPLGTDQEAPTRWEVRTFGIAVIEDQDYNVSCEGHRGLGAGQYNGRWEKNGTLTLLAPRTATARLLQVTCKTSPRK